MNTFEVIKFVEFYLMETIVVGVVGITVLAGLYQLIRSKVRGGVSAPAKAPKA